MIPLLCNLSSVLHRTAEKAAFYTVTMCVWKKNENKAQQNHLNNTVEPLKAAGAAGHYNDEDQAQDGKHNCILTTLSDKHSLQTFREVNCNFT